MIKTSYGRGYNMIRVAQPINLSTEKLRSVEEIPMKNRKEHSYLLSLQKVAEM